MFLAKFTFIFYFVMVPHESACNSCERFSLNFFNIALILIILKVCFMPVSEDENLSYVAISVSHPSLFYSSVELKNTGTRTFIR